MLTIGVYGASAAAFFAALEEAGADILLDVRTRRAVRGAQYAYANAKRLIAALDRRGIAYRHVLELAPGRELLDLQHAVDAREHVAYSKRTALAPQYVRRYVREVLEPFDFAALARELHGYRAPVLLCVERSAAACHRGLIAPKLARALRAKVVDLVP
ncbi:MAG TPA: DUF488 family protein [Candidatus Elarobacter sp.]|nr:DUF488 family protein [Candidatus Elarobacter sp.]